MQSQRSVCDFNGQEFHIGIDVHLRSWAITIRSQGMELETFSMNPRPTELAKHMHRKYPNGTYKSVYEAGFSGFSAHRKLLELGVANIVINPSDIPTKNKEKVRKTDRIDSRKLARELQNGELEPIYVPTVQQQDLRSLCRLRQRLVAHSTRLKNRIKQHFYFRGIDLPPHCELHHWSASFIAWLESQCPAGRNPGADTLRITLDELKAQRERICQVTKLLRRYTNGLEILHYLRSIPGIGPITSVTLLVEIIRIDRFLTFDQLCSFVGLVPSCASSGEKQRDGQLTPRGNRHLRHVLIEAAWVAVKKDPELLQAYSKFSSKMGKQKAIIKIARKLLNRIRFVWQNRTNYEVLTA